FICILFLFLFSFFFSSRRRHTRFSRDWSSDVCSSDLLNLVRNFIRTGLDRADPNDRPTIDEAVAHVEHIADLHGHRRGVGLGSDLDGGITGHDLPAGINAPRDFDRLAEALARRGWSDTDLEAFAWGNWARFFSVTAPAG